MLIIENGLACGIGRGEECCAFLTAGREGFLCGRTDDGVRITVLTRLLAGTMNAKYDPGDTPYPECQPGEKPRSVC